MGWKLKTLALVFALIFVQTGAWIISLVLFLYTISGFFRRGPTARSFGKGATPPQSAPTSEVRHRWSWRSLLRYGLGFLFILLAAVAYLEGGVFSPIAYLAVGLLLVIPWTAFPGLGGLRPVEDSILLRGRFDPFHWFAVAEVKFATKRVANALSGLDEQVVITEKESGRASIFIVLRRTALTHQGAEDSVIDRLGELARACAPLGAYVLPMDSAEAAALLSLSTKPVDFDPKSWLLSLSTADYDLVSLDVWRGVVRGVGFYKTVPGDSGPRVPPAGKSIIRAPLLREVLEEAGKKAQWPNPDEYTAFLAGLFATRAEPLGQEIVHEAVDGGEGQQQEVLVGSAGAQRVKMTRAQLRATSRAYQGRGG